MLYRKTKRGLIGGSDIKKTAEGGYFETRNHRPQHTEDRCDRQKNGPLKAVHVLIPGTCDHVKLLGKFLKIKRLLSQL